MAGSIIEVKYFNTFLLKKVNNNAEKVIWNGSFGIPTDIGGQPVLDVNRDASWAIEESRIRGGYNNTSVDFGAKAYLVEDEPNGTRRFNTLIYSGIFNSRTGINQTNVFSVGEDITKSADPANGSIQKLYAEDTNLNVFQELKVSRALIDKDAIYSAEGGGTVTASNLVIGVIQPYPGKYGISKNPESFAIYGNNKYFSDKNNNAVLRLSGGIEEISSYGMKDFFRDELVRTTSLTGEGRILGAWDIYSSEYVVSLQRSRTSRSPLIATRRVDPTLVFDERAKGWVSFHSYVPDQMFSLRNNFYSVKTTSYNDLASTTVNSLGSTSFPVTFVNGDIPVGSLVTSTLIPPGLTVSVLSYTPTSFNTGVVVVDTSIVLSASVPLLFTDSSVNLWRHNDNSVNRNSFYGVEKPSSITFVFNPNPTNSKSFKTIGYEGSNGWQVDSFVSDETSPTLGISGNWNISNDFTAEISSLYEGEYILTEGKALAPIVTNSASMTLDVNSVGGYILAGGEVSGEQIPGGFLTVVSYDVSTGDLVLSQPVTFTEVSELFFSAETSSNDYAAVFSNSNPPLPRYYSGFNLKENKYVANLINDSLASAGEIIFGNQISGIKGYYSTVKMSTDLTTDFGGEKSLFSVESTYSMNNGY